MTSVLYVDDEESLLDIGKIFLSRMGGFEVTLESSARKALELLKNRQFDAIISDYQMPGMDGIALLQEIREQYGEIPFILFTGRGREDVVILALNSGADYYLQKGGDPESQFTELVHKVRQSVQRRQTETTLKESEEKFRVLAENAPAAITIVQDGMDVFVNEYTTLMTGYDKEEYQKRDFLSFIHPDFHDLIRERSAARLRGEVLPNRYEIKYLTRDGDARWADLSADTITYRGRPALIAMLVDITDRKHALDELQATNEELTAAQEELQVQLTELRDQQIRLSESEQSHRSIIEKIQDPYYCTDLDSRILMVNPAFATAFGYQTTEELIGKKILDMFSVDPAESAGFMNSLFQNGEVHEFRINLKLSDGSIRSFTASTHLIYDSDRNPTGVEGTLHDITNHSRIEEAFTDIETKYHDFSEFPPMMLFEMNPSFSITYANRYALDCLGYTSQDIREGLPLTALVDQSVQTDLFDAILNPGNGNFLEAREFICVKKDGTRIPALISVAVHSDHAVIRYCGFIIDISEQKDRTRQ